MIVIADRAGQLGNQLAVFSNVIAWARENHAEVAYPGFSYGSWFEGTRLSKPWARFPSHHAGGPVLPSELAHFLTRLVSRAAKWGRTPMKVISLPWMKTCELESQAFSSLSEQYRTLLLEGWLFRAPYLLEKHRNEILNFFHPVAPLRTPADLLISRLRQEVDAVVGIHIRQGDYETHLGGKHFFQTIDYAGIMARIRDEWYPAKVGFVVCSDVAQDWSVFDGFCIRIGKGHPVVDLWTLGQADAIVGPPSSFSMWASFVGSRPLHWITELDQSLDADAACFPPLEMRSPATPIYWGLSLDRWGNPAVRAQ